MEASVNKRIADIETAVTTPVTIQEIDGLFNSVTIYDGDYAFAVTPDKAVYSWAESNIGRYNGIDDDLWQKEKDSFAVAN